jgi:quercetin dioxygenase-like cupin family protein
MNPIEAYESKDRGVKFYFTHSDDKFTTGVMVIRPQYELPKHNRPLAVENLVQISGTCLMKLFTELDEVTEHILAPGTYLQIKQGQYHIHANPYDVESVTLFKAEGDITAVMEVLRKEFSKI